MSGSGSTSLQSQSNVYKKLMAEDPKIYKIEDIEFQVIYSGRKTLGISVRPDSSVIVRVPYLTSFKTINRIVRKEKYGWLLKHRDNYRDSIIVR